MSFIQKIDNNNQEILSQTVTQHVQNALRKHCTQNEQLTIHRCSLHILSVKCYVINTVNYSTVTPENIRVYI